MRIDTSIQDFLRKINSRILFYVSPTEILFFFSLSLSLLLFIGILSFVTKDERHVFVYTEGKDESVTKESATRKNNAYFASKSGKVYYTSFCKAGNRVKEGNRIYFTLESEAKSSGRELSKLCE